MIEDLLDYVWVNNVSEERWTGHSHKQALLIRCRPLLGVMENTQDFNAIRTDILSIDHDKRYTINHQFSCIFQSALATGSGVIR